VPDSYQEQGQEAGQEQEQEAGRVQEEVSILELGEDGRGLAEASQDSIQELVEVTLLRDSIQEQEELHPKDSIQEQEELLHRVSTQVEEELHPKDSIQEVEERPHRVSTQVEEEDLHPRVSTQEEVPLQALPLFP